MENNEILQKISRLMQERHWTLYQLAKESGLSYSTLCSLYLKNNQPTVSSLASICAAFHISLSEFFCDETPFRINSYQFSKEEVELIELIRSLEKPDRELLMSYIRDYFAGS